MVVVLAVEVDTVVVAADIIVVIILILLLLLVEMLLLMIRLKIMGAQARTHNEDIERWEED